MTTESRTTVQGDESLHRVVSPAYGGDTLHPYLSLPLCRSPSQTSPRFVPGWTPKVPKGCPQRGQPFPTHVRPVQSSPSEPGLPRRPGYRLSISEHRTTGPRDGVGGARPERQGDRTSLGQTQRCRTRESSLPSQHCLVTTAPTDTP